jgi:hypothetical protein
MCSKTEVSTRRINSSQGIGENSISIVKTGLKYPHNRAAARRRAVEAADEGVRAEWRPGAAKTRAADVNGGGAR